MSPEWREYETWHSLWAWGRGVILARVYKGEPLWGIELLTEPRILTEVDPNLTLDEVKQIVQTLVGSQT